MLSLVFFTFQFVSLMQNILKYAGTDALKGDITRSGQRNLVGMVKDGYNSASRYYLSHMRDAQRQLAVDAVLGNFNHFLLNSFTKAFLQLEECTTLCSVDNSLSQFPNFFTCF